MAVARAPARRRSSRAPPTPPLREFRQARARASYEKLLAAAATLFAERGYHATQTPDIAERAGMSVGGLYRHFRDKHQIFVELIHKGLEANRIGQDQMAEALASAVEAGEIDLRRATDAIVELAFSMNQLPAELLRTFTAMSYQDETIASLREQYDRYERESIARMLARITRRDWIPLPLAAAKLLDITLESLGQWTALHPGPDSRGVKKAAADMLYRYLVDPELR